MFLISDGKNYIGLNSDNTQTTVRTVNKALSFSEKQKACNYRDNLKTTLRKFDWKIIEVKNSGSTDVDDEIEDNICETEVPQYIETELEKDNFDIVEFFSSTIKTVSQLKEYAANMDFLEKEYNKKILDVRHYKRDIKIKLNAIQLQRLEQFEIQLERERYECKSNKIIANMFLNDFSRMENIDYIEEIKKVKESEYHPKILTYELLDEIVGRKCK